MNIDFFAMLHRLRNIRRWGLMRNQMPENVQEHAFEVAILAHVLAVVRARYFAAGRTCPSPDAVALHALFHDATEILTGDMPTPAKYYSRDMRRTYAELESAAADHLLSMVPDDLRDIYAPLLTDGGGETAQATAELVKAADRLSALIKCDDELQIGNQEFAAARRYVFERLEGMALPEVAWFMEHVYPSFAKNLDELGGTLSERA